MVLLLVLVLEFHMGNEQAHRRPNIHLELDLHPTGEEMKNERPPQNQTARKCFHLRAVDLSNDVLFQFVKRGV